MNNLGFANDDDPEYQAFLRKQQEDRTALTHVPQDTGANQPPVVPQQLPGAALLDMPRPPSPTATVNITDNVPRGAGTAPVEREITTSHTPTAEERRLTKERDALETDITAADKKDQEIQTRATALAQRAAKVEADAAKEELAYRQNLQLERQKKQQEQDALVAQAHARVEAERQKYSGMELKDFWSQKTTGQKIAAAFFSIVGGIGAGMAHQQNVALQVIDQATKEDFDLQRAQIDKQAKQIEFATGSALEAERFRTNALGDLQSKEAEGLRLLAAKRVADLKALGVADTAIAGDKVANELQKKALAATEARKNTAIQQQMGLRTETQHTREDPAFTGAGRTNIDLNVYGPGGAVVGRVKDPKAAADANKANGAFRQLDSILGEIEKSYRENGKLVNPLGDVANTRAALKAQAVIAFKNMADLGALSGPDMGLVSSAIEGGLTGEQAANKLATARRALAQGQAAFLDSKGLPGKQVMGALNGQGGGASPQADKEAVDWAKAHPDDPRAKRILQLHGM